ncbi:MAG: TIGR00266 family protein [Pirellulaceae bacterium]
MLDIQCPSCLKPYRVAPQHRGRQVRCQQCGMTFVAEPVLDRAAPGEEPPPVGTNPWSHLREEELEGEGRKGAGARSTNARGGRIADEIDYVIRGDDTQFVEITLDPGETVIAEAGAMMFMTDGIEMQTVFGDPSRKGAGFWDKVMSAGKRALTGESLFMTTFTNSRSAGREVVAFSAPYSGKIVPMHLDEMGGEIICQKDAFLCGAKGIELTVAFQKKIGTAIFGGEGFIMQRLKGDGIAMVHASGTMLQRTLATGEKLRLDTGCLMALGPTVQYDIQYAGKIKNALFGGEGLFLATLTGPGPVWLQSLPFSRLAGRLMRGAHAGGSLEEGSVLRGLGSLGSSLLGDQ